MKIKITTIVGTRPEIIRLSQVIKLFDNYANHRLIHTGQNYTESLNSIFFRDLDVREPDVRFKLSEGTFANTLAAILVQAEQELQTNRPDAVVILGDTNSALTALIAKKLQIPIYHLEAGNRSFDPNVPEEINRGLVDQISDFNLVYTEHARRNLISEGKHPRTICLIGSPLKEVIDLNLKSIESSQILEKLNLKSGNFFVVSVHRQENVNSKARLVQMLKMIEEVAEVFKLPIFVSTHPRTRSKLEKIGKIPSENIIWHDPVGFHDYCKLQKESKLTLSDSGSLSEESAILGFKAITLRDSMERPEALEAGTVMMAGINSNSLIDAIQTTTKIEKKSLGPSEYFIADSSQRTLNFIYSTLPNYFFWSGIRRVAADSF